MCLFVSNPLRCSIDQSGLPGEEWSRLIHIYHRCSSLSAAVPFCAAEPFLLATTATDCRAQSDTTCRRSEILIAGSHLLGTHAPIKARPPTSSSYLPFLTIPSVMDKPLGNKPKEDIRWRDPGSICNAGSRHVRKSSEISWKMMKGR